MIVHHHTTCGHVKRDTCHERAVSPDNLSESSISFHENEVNFDLSPGSLTRGIPGSVGASLNGNSTIKHFFTGQEGDHQEPMPDPPGIWYDGPLDPCVSVLREPVKKTCDNKQVHNTLPNRSIQYSNWESCRESWFSSGRLS